MRGQGGSRASCCRVCLISGSSLVPVMMPAYTQNRACALFFIIFTLIGKRLHVLALLAPRLVSVTLPQSTLTLEFPLSHSLSFPSALPPDLHLHLTSQCIPTL